MTDISVATATRKQRQFVGRDLASRNGSFTGGPFLLAIADRRIGAGETTVVLLTGSGLKATQRIGELS